MLELKHGVLWLLLLFVLTGCRESFKTEDVAWADGTDEADKLWLSNPSNPKINLALLGSLPSLHEN